VVLACVHAELRSGQLLVQWSGVVFQNRSAAQSEGLRHTHVQLQVVADAGVEHARTHNRRTLDVLAARTAFYLSLAHERLDTLATLRPRLLSLHATAVLNHDDVGQEVLLNLLLRNYLHYNLYDQAEKLRAQAQRPEAPRSNQQYCRYLYYLGRIRAVQLEYSEAKECLQQAARKVRPALSMACHACAPQPLPQHTLPCMRAAAAAAAHPAAPADAASACRRPAWRRGSLSACTSGSR
jgi:tetratricopeptide (TPR) repeat protein